MMNKLLSMLIVLLSINLSATAANSEVSIQATSTLNAKCEISANSISFGALLSPLNSQSATGTLDVFCNKGVPYTIEMFYGGIYGTGETINGILPFASQRYLGFAQGVGSIYSCSYGGVINGVTYQQNTTEYNYCGSQIPYNASISYNYGKMIGVSKGDNIAYAIYVPNEPTKVWNNGINSYAGTSDGTLQSLSMVVKVVPGQSGAIYPTPDMYMDTVTVKINY